MSNNNNNNHEQHVRHEWPFVQSLFALSTWEWLLIPPFGPPKYIYSHVYTLHITHFLYMECICLDMTMSNIHTAYYLYVFYTLNICNASCIWLIYINVVLNWCHGQNNHLTMCCDSVMQRSICCWMRPFWCSGRASRLLKWQNEQQQQQPHSHNFECDFCCCCACCCWCC